MAILLGEFAGGLVGWLTTTVVIATERQFTAYDIF